MDTIYEKTIEEYRKFKTSRLHECYGLYFSQSELFELMKITQLRELEQSINSLKNYIDCLCNSINELKNKLEEE